MKRAHPACFTSEQWIEWSNMAHVAGMRRGSYCRDCTQRYHDEMVTAGRCEHPDTKFHIVAGGVVGYRNGDDPKKDEGET